MAGVYFLVFNVRLVRRPSPGLAWANFKASMVYLTILLAALMADAFRS